MRAPRTIPPVRRAPIVERVAPGVRSGATIERAASPTDVAPALAVAVRAQIASDRRAVVARDAVQARCERAATVQAAQVTALGSALIRPALEARPVGPRGGEIMRVPHSTGREAWRAADGAIGRTPIAIARLGARAHAAWAGHYDRAIRASVRSLAPDGRDHETWSRLRAMSTDETVRWPALARALAEGVAIVGRGPGYAERYLDAREGAMGAEVADRLAEIEATIDAIVGSLAYVAWYARAESLRGEACARALSWAALGRDDTIVMSGGPDAALRASIRRAERIAAGVVSAPPALPAPTPPHAPGVLRTRPIGPRARQVAPWPIVLVGLANSTARPTDCACAVCQADRALALWRGIR